MRLQKISQGKQLRSTCSPQLLLLCLFVAVGAIIGFFVQKAVSTESNAELCEYLHQYAACSAQGSCTPVSFLRVAAVYFRYPLLAFCLGFCAFGIYLLPLLCAVQGFFLSFSVCCFASAMGRAGVYLAFSAFGLRVLITLPCLMLLALQAFHNARALSGIAPQKNRNAKNKLSASYFILFGICSIVLLLGTILEITFLPHIFQWMIEKIA